MGKKAVGKTQEPTVERKVDDMTEEEEELLRRLSAKKKARERGIPKLQMLMDRFPTTGKQLAIEKYGLIEKDVRTKIPPENVVLVKNLKEVANEIYHVDVRTLIDYLKSKPIMDYFPNWMKAQQERSGQNQQAQQDGQNQQAQQDGQNQQTQQDGQQG
jgi:hypothetical protein